MHKLVGGSRGLIGTAVFVVAIIASSFGTAWTAAPAFAANVDPLLRAGDLALVHTTAGTAGALSAKLAGLGATDVATYTSVDMVVARVSTQALAELRTDATVTAAAADTTVVALGRGTRTGFESSDRWPTYANQGKGGRGSTSSATGDPSIVSTGAPLAWSRTTGRGVTVALMDTGVAKVDDLKVNLESQQDFVNDGAKGDPAGHGTFLAGIIAANGEMRGMAPDARIVSLRVLDANGNGRLSYVVAAFDWTLKNRRHVDVLNLSWGAPQSTSYHNDILSALVEATWFAGVTVVAASGNGGAVVTPGSDPFIVTAGAYDDRGTLDLSDDTFATFTGSGRTLDGFVKPDLLGPGVSVTSLRAPGVVYRDASGNPIGDPSDHFIHMTGTSAATAYVSGAAALVLGARNSYSPTQVKGALVASARDIAGSHFDGVNAFGALRERPAEVNEHLVPSRLLLSILNKAGLLSLSRKGVTWEGVTWESITWESITWESVSWEGVTWEGVTWEQVDQQ